MLYIQGKGKQYLIISKMHKQEYWVGWDGMNINFITHAHMLLILRTGFLLDFLLSDVKFDIQKLKYINFSNHFFFVFFSLFCRF